MQALPAAYTFRFIETEDALLTGRQNLWILINRIHRACIRTPTALDTYPDIMDIRIFQIDDDPTPLWVEDRLMSPSADRLAPMAVNTDIIILSQPRHPNTAINLELYTAINFRRTIKILIKDLCERSSPP